MSKLIKQLENGEVTVQSNEAPAWILTALSVLVLATMEIALAVENYHLSQENAGLREFQTRELGIKTCADTSARPGAIPLGELVRPQATMKGTNQ